MPGWQVSEFASGERSTVMAIEAKGAATMKSRRRFSTIFTALLFVALKPERHRSKAKARDSQASKTKLAVLHVVPPGFNAVLAPAKLIG